MNGDSVDSASSLVNGEVDTMTACSKQQLSDGPQDAGCGTGQSPALEPKPSGLSNGNSVVNSGDDSVQSDQSDQAVSGGVESAMDIDVGGDTSAMDIDPGDGTTCEQDECQKDGDTAQIMAAKEEDETVGGEELARSDQDAQRGNTETIQNIKPDDSCASVSTDKQDGGLVKAPDGADTNMHNGEGPKDADDGVDISKDRSQGQDTNPSNRLTTVPGTLPEPDNEGDDASEPVPSRGETPVLDSHPSSVVETTSRASTPSREVISLVDLSSDENSTGGHATPSVGSSCVSTPARSRSVTPSQVGSQSSTPIPTRQQQDIASSSCSPSPRALTGDVAPTDPAAVASSTPAATEEPITSVSPTSTTASATTSSTEAVAPSPNSSPSSATPAQSKLEKVLPLSHKEVGLRPMADLLVDIGQSLVCQQVYRDLVKVQRKRKLQNRLTPEEEKQLPKMEELYEVAVELNQPYHMDEFQCNRCSFHSESKSVLELHKEFPHMATTGTCICAHCDTECNNVSSFVDHMTSVHKKKGQMPPRVNQFSCPLCPYEHNSRALFIKHLAKCHRSFHPSRNCEPLPADSDIPLKKMKVLSPTQPRGAVQPKQQHRPQILKPYRDVRQPTANSTVNKTVSSILGNMKARRPPPILRQTQATPMQRPVLSSTMVPQPVPSGMSFSSAGTGQPQYVQMGNNFYCLMMHNGRQMLVPVVNPSSAQPSSVQGLINPRVAPPSVAAAANFTRQSAHVRSPKLQQMPTAAAPGKTVANLPHSSFHVCEICCGCIRDRESLRIHFKMAHKVEIPAEMFHKKQPYLFCAQCRERFWTYQGLRIHQQKRHNLQKGSPKPAAPVQPPPQPKPVEHTCIVCNKEKLIDILDHLHCVHGISVDMQINMKTCMVCGKALSTEAETKEHLQKQHPTILIGKNAGMAPKKPTTSALSAASAQQAMPRTSPALRTAHRGAPQIVDKSQTPYCPQCFVEFSSVPEYMAHRHAMHTFMCSRCPVKQNRCTSYSTRENLRRHVALVHSNDVEPCPLCKDLVGICGKFLDHVTKTHLKKCTVVVERMSDAQLSQYKLPAKSKSEEVVIVEENAQVNKPHKDGPKTVGVNGRRRSLRSSGVHEEIIEVDGEQVHIVQQQDSDSD